MTHYRYPKKVSVDNAGGGAPGNVNLAQVAGTTVLTDYGLSTGNAPRVVAAMQIGGQAITNINPMFIAGATGATFPVTASALPLPTGAATSAAQATAQTNFSNIDANTAAFNIKIASASWPASQLVVATQSGGVQLVAGLAVGWDGTNHREMAVSTTGFVKVDGSATTQPISAAALPLPTGASTSAIQTTQQTSLNSIDTKLTTVAIRALTTADFVSAAQSGTWNLTNISGTISLPTGASTSALQSTGNTSLASIDTKLVQFALGAGTVASSLRTFSIPGNVAGIADFGAGATSAQTQRVALANESLPSTGTTPVQIVSATQKSYIIDMASTNMTTAYLQIIASTPGVINSFEVFNGSGEPMFLATGAAAAEISQYVIPPGGTTGFVMLAIPAGTRIAVKTFANTVSSGYFILNTLS